VAWVREAFQIRQEMMFGPCRPCRGWEVFGFVCYSDSAPMAPGGTPNHHPHIRKITPYCVGMTFSRINCSALVTGMVAAWISVNPSLETTVSVMPFVDQFTKSPLHWT